VEIGLGDNPLHYASATLNMDSVSVRSSSSAPPA